MTSSRLTAKNLLAGHTSLRRPEAPQTRSIRAFSMSSNELVAAPAPNISLSAAALSAGDLPTQSAFDVIGLEDTDGVLAIPSDFERRSDRLSALLLATFFDLGVP